MISVADLKAWLKVENSDDDAVIANLEVRAVAFVEHQTGRYFGEPKEFVEVVSGAGVQLLYLRRGAVASPAPVIESYDGSAWSVIAGSDYTIDGAALWSTTTWPYGERNIRVTYTAGYEPGEEPGDIRQAVMDMVAVKYRARQSGSEGLQSESISGYSYTRQDIMEIPGLGPTLASWRRVRV